MADIKPDAPAVTAQKSKKVGDDEVFENVREIKPEVVREQADAQVVQPREGDSDKVNVHEVAVALDEVITDPSSPLAVQVPDAGRGSLDLPIHRLSGPTVENVFASEAKSADKSDDES